MYQYYLQDIVKQHYDFFYEYLRVVHISHCENNLDTDRHRYTEDNGIGSGPSIVHDTRCRTCLILRIWFQSKGEIFLHNIILISILVPKVIRSKEWADIWYQQQLSLFKINTNTHLQMDFRHVGRTLSRLTPFGDIYQRERKRFLLINTNVWNTDRDILWWTKEQERKKNKRLETLKKISYFTFTYEI